MADTNLVRLFTDIADAIRSKTGDTRTIRASSFPTVIRDIPTGNIKVETFEFDNTENFAYPKPFTFEYEGTALGIYIDGEAYTSAGVRASNYDNALSWNNGMPNRGLAKYGTSYGVSTVPTATAGNNPTIQAWDGNTVTFRTSNNINYARCKFTVTVYSE